MRRERDRSGRAAVETHGRVSPRAKHAKGGAGADSPTAVRAKRGGRLAKTT
jgi:hypothetical protein